MSRKQLFLPRKRHKICQAFACLLYPSHGPLRFITSHSFCARLCHGKNEAPEEEAGPGWVSARGMPLTSRARMSTICEMTVKGLSHFRSGALSPVSISAISFFLGWRKFSSLISYHVLRGSFLLAVRFSWKYFHLAYLTELFTLLLETLKYARFLFQEVSALLRIFRINL